MEANSKRYITLPNYKGIRKDTETGKYLVTKSINGKRSFKSFASLKEAAHWKNAFNPLVQETTQPTNSRIKLNGEKAPYTFKEVWELYERFHVSGLELASQEHSRFMMSLFDSLSSTPINSFVPELIDDFLQVQKNLIIEENKKRCSFKGPLKFLKAIFNFYRENYDYTFVNPILKRHHTLGTIKQAPKREKKLSGEEIIQFFEALSPFYRDVAIIQFYIAGRVQEVAGIQMSSIDLSNRSLLVKDVVVWDKKKRFLDLKPYTKNGQIRFCYLNDELLEVVKRRLSEVPTGCTYLLHEKGEPLKYRKIQHEYNKALKKCGLDKRFSSTHILRHSMATITRRVTGSIDAVQAVTGHVDQRMCQHYASLPEKAQVDAVVSVEGFLKSLTLARASNCEQNKKGA